VVRPLYVWKSQTEIFTIMDNRTIENIRDHELSKPHDSFFLIGKPNLKNTMTTSLHISHQSTQKHTPKSLTLTKPSENMWAPSTMYPLMISTNSATLKHVIFKAIAQARAAPPQMRNQSRNIIQLGERLTPAACRMKGTIAIKRLHANTGIFVTSAEACIPESYVLVRSMLMPDWHHNEQCSWYLDIHALCLLTADIKPP
jgi:hypothetical protein